MLFLSITIITTGVFFFFTFKSVRSLPVKYLIYDIKDSFPSYLIVLKRHIQNQFLTYIKIQVKCCCRFISKRSHINSLTTHCIKKLCYVWNSLLCIFNRWLFIFARQLKFSVKVFLTWRISTRAERGCDCNFATYDIAAFVDEKR